MTAAKKIEYGKDFELQVENAATRSSGSFMTLTLGGNEAVLKPKGSNRAMARLIELQKFQMFAAFAAPNGGLKRHEFCTRCVAKLGAIRLVTSNF